MASRMILRLRRQIGYRILVGRMSRLTRILIGSLAAALLAVAAQGNLRSETLRAFSREEMRAIISKVS